jgi:ABC-type branched-subunit amino acid transport system substrate-binding protein
MRLLRSNSLSLYIVALLLMLSAVSCDPTKRAAKNKPNLDYGQNTPLPPQPTVTDTPQPTHTTTTPTTPPVVVSTPTIHIDTVRWTDVSEPTTPEPSEPVASTPSVSTPPNSTSTTLPSEGVLKQTYEVAVLLPFLTDRYLNNEIPKQAKTALDFYAGVSMAFKALESEGVSLNVQVLDTNADSSRIGTLMRRQEVTDADIIIGGVTKDVTKQMAQYAAKNKKIMVSPFQPRTDLVTQNPYYVQVTPSLNTHFQNMLEYIHNRFGTSANVILLSNSNNFTVQRFEAAQSANKLSLGASARLPEYVGTTAISDALVKGTNIVIMPTMDESYVVSTLRSLSQYGGNNFYVFGMPQWYDFTKLEPEVAQKLNVHITTDYFMDLEDAKVKQFLRDYVNRYGIFPPENAVKGYDVMLYFGRLLQKHGTGMLGKLETSNAQTIATRYEFVPNFLPTAGGAEKGAGANIKNLENRYVSILRYGEEGFERVK